MNNDPQSVWLSREEYERLRALEGTSTTTNSVAASVAQAAQGSAAGQSQPAQAVLDDSNKPSQTTSWILTGVTIVCAPLAYMMPIFTIVFIVVGILSIIFAARSRNKTAPLAVSITVLALGFVAIIPMLLLFLLIGWFQVQCWFDASACRSV